MGKTSLQRDNKNAGKGTNLRAASLAAAFIMGAGLVMSGCGFTRAAAAAPTDTPDVTQQVKPTPTAKATDTPVPTPSPTTTPKTVPILTDEQVQEQMQFLNVVTPNEKINLNRITFVCYYRIDESGNKIYTIEFTKIQGRISNGNTILIRLSDDTPIFEFDSNYEYLEDAPQQVAIVPRCESLKDVKVCAISRICSVGSTCEEFGIPYNENATSLSKNFHAMSRGRISYDGEYTYRELLELYIKLFLSENRAVASDFVGPIDYVAPTASPETKETPIPTVAPTLFRDGNASVKYLIGEIDLDREMENKTKRM